MAEGGEVFTQTIPYSTTTDFSHDDFSIDDVQAELYENGVAVVSNVLLAEDCDAYQDQIRVWLATFGNTFPENFKSVLHQYNIAHLEPMWRIRHQTKPVFRALWGTDKLLSSMDGLAIGRPPEEGQTTFGEAENRADLHLDQGRLRRGLHAYQGAVYLEESLPDDWCLAVMLKSHKHFREFFKSHDSGRSEHKKLTCDEIDWYLDHDCVIRRMAVPKGGMVIWDSRTVHAGAPPVQGRRNPGRWRYVCFVCQAPAIWATQKDMALKKEAYEKLLCTHHWPANGVANSEYKRTKYDLVTLPHIAKSVEAKQLAGAMPYDFNNDESNGPKWKPKWNN